MAKRQPVASDRGKRSLYFPRLMLDELRAEAERQERSESWLLQTAWEMAREAILQFEGRAERMAPRLPACEPFKGS